MGFSLRDKNGVLKAKLSDRTGMTLINQGNGFGRDVQSKREGMPVIVRVFEFDQDSYLQVNDELRLYFWEGDILVPEY